MPGATPEATFSEARQAMERGDWEGLFACLDAADVKKVARNLFSLFATATGANHDAFRQICGRYGIPPAAIAEIQARGRAITESARQPIPPPGPAMLEQSRRHQQIVNACQQARWTVSPTCPGSPAPWSGRCVPMAKVARCPRPCSSAKPWSS